MEGENPYLKRQAFLCGRSSISVAISKTGDLSVYCRDLIDQELFLGCVELRKSLGKISRNLIEVTGTPIELSR